MAFTFIRVLLADIEKTVFQDKQRANPNFEWRHFAQMETDGII